LMHWGVIVGKTGAAKLTRLGDEKRAKLYRLQIAIRSGVRRNGPGNYPTRTLEVRVGASLASGTARKIFSGKRAAKIGVRLTAVAIGRTAASIARNKRTRLAAITIRAARAAVVWNARTRLPAIVVAAASQSGRWAGHRLVGVNRLTGAGRLLSANKPRTCQKAKCDNNENQQALAQ
jgi:hypothetical protein